MSSSPSDIYAFLFGEHTVNDKVIFLCDGPSNNLKKVSVHRVTYSWVSGGDRSLPSERRDKNSLSNLLLLSETSLKKISLLLISSKDQLDVQTCQFLKWVGKE